MPGVGDDVEIPAAQSILVLRLVDGAHRHADAEPIERGLVEQKHALEIRILGEEFDRVRLAGLAVDELVVADLVARLFQQPHRLAQILPHRLWIAADRIGIGGGKNLGRHLVAHLLQNLELAAFRQAAGGKFSAFEVAGDALVLTEEDLLVHLLEIERQIEGAAHARILELGRGGC